MNLKNIFKITILLIAILLILAISTFINVYAAGNCAFSAGVGYGDVNMSTAIKKAATTYGTMGYSSYYATETATYSTLNGYFSNGTRRLESDIVFLSGHGTSKQISTLLGQGLIKGSKFGESNYVGTEDISWKNVKMAIFLACQTGNGDDNLVYDVFRRSGWTTISMGWRQDISQGSAKEWISNFNSKLATGANVDNSLSYANGKSYSDSRVKDLSFYGPGGTVLKKQRASSASNNGTSPITIDESNVNKIYNKNFYYDGTEESKTNLIAAITSINNSFKAEQYEINSYKIKNDGSYYTIDFTYKEGEFYTNSSYTVIVEDNYVTQIIDNTKNKDLVSIQSETNFADDELIETAKNAAKNELETSNEISLFKQNFNNNIEIIGQEIRLFKDLEKNKNYIQIFTTYKFEENVENACFEYMYEI